MMKISRICLWQFKGEKKLIIINKKHVLFTPVAVFAFSAYKVWYTFHDVLLQLVSGLCKIEVMLALWKHLCQVWGHNNSHNASVFTTAATVVVFNTKNMLSPAYEVTALVPACCTVCGLTWRSLHTARLWRQSVFSHFHTWWLSTLTCFSHSLTFISSTLPRLEITGRCETSLSKKKKKKQKNTGLLLY